MLDKDICSRVLDFLFPLPSHLVESLNKLQKNQLPKPSELLEPWMNALFAYDDKGKQIVQAVKYKRNRSAINICSLVLYEQILSFYSDEMNHEKEVVLVPIPMPASRRLFRYYNPPEEISKSISKISSSSLVTETHVLKKKGGKSQRECRTKQERQKNIRGRFICHEQERIIGKDIILIDDVITTGATMIEARKILIESGAKRVIGFALAH